MAKKPTMTWKLSRTAGKQLALIVKKNRLRPDQITEMLDRAGEYAIDSHKQGLAAMEQVADQIGDDVMQQMRDTTEVEVIPGDLRMVFDQMFPRAHGTKRRPQDA